VTRASKFPIFSFFQNQKLFLVDNTFYISLFTSLFWNWWCWQMASWKGNL